MQHIIDIAEKLQDDQQEIDQNMVSRYKIVIDTKLKLINKYLPDVKAVEHTGENGEGLVITINDSRGL